MTDTEPLELRAVPNAVLLELDGNWLRLEPTRTGVAITTGPAGLPVAATPAQLVELAEVLETIAAVIVNLDDHDPTEEATP